MIKLRNLTLNGTPRVAVGFTDAANTELLRHALDYGVDVAELRIDQYKSYEKDYVIDQIQKFTCLPTIATIRSKSEGGAWNLPESQRLDLFKHILTKVDAIDIESSSISIAPDLINAAHKAGKLVVVSYHNFSATPNLVDLTKTINEAKNLGADIVKIATHIKDRENLHCLAHLTLENKAKNLIVIGMGPLGTLTRILFPALGSLLTYAFIGQPTAPGQLDYSMTADFLRKLYPNYNQEKINSLQLLELA